MLRVIIDTNILVGGVWDEDSYSRKIIEEVIKGNIRAYASHRTMKENKMILMRAVRDKKYVKRLEKFFDELNIVKPEKRLKVVSDNEDNKLFESAVAAGADYLVTSDQEVLDVREYEGTKVVHPGEFWAEYKAKSESEDKPWRDWIDQVMGE